MRMLEYFHLRSEWQHCFFSRATEERHPSSCQIWNSYVLYRSRWHIHQHRYVAFIYVLQIRFVRSVGGPNRHTYTGAHSVHFPVVNFNICFLQKKKIIAISRITRISRQWSSVKCACRVCYIVFVYSHFLFCNLYKHSVSFRPSLFAILLFLCVTNCTFRFC